MPDYKLTYFDFAGSRGEDCRMALYLAGVDFEDNRLKREEWLALKPKVPFGTLPVLERSGRTPLAQSNAILGYIGRGYGLLPSDAWTAAQHLAVLESVEEVRTAMGPSGKLTDADAKRKAREEFAAGTLSTWCAQMEAQIQGPFLAGAQISVADLKVFTLVHAIASGVMDHISPAVFEAFPKLRGLKEAVAAQPRVNEWRRRFL